MITAKEYLLELGFDDAHLPELFNDDDKSHYQITELMVEFAKMHVQEALKQASEKAEVATEYENPVNPSMGSFEVVDKCSILDAYSLDNVK